jgi:hypothetical protein
VARTIHTARTSVRSTSLKRRGSFTARMKPWARTAVAELGCETSVECVVRTTQSWLPPFSKKPIAARARSESGTKPPKRVWNSSKELQSTASPMGPRSVRPTAPASRRSRA